MFSKTQTELQSYEGPDFFDENCLFSSPYHHLHRRNAGKEFQWFSTDNPDRYNRESGYSESDISYKFNSHGYRCDELQKSSMLFLGCSYTFGVGLPLQDVWAAKLAAHFNTPYCNVAFHGGSATYNLRALQKVWDLVKPDKVIALLPYSHRLEFFSDDPGNPLKVWVKSGIRSQNFSGPDRERLLNYELYTNQRQEDLHLLSHVFSMNNFVKAKGSRFIWGVWEYEEKASDFFLKYAVGKEFGEFVKSDVFDNHTRWKDLNKKARDSSHPGRQFHEQFFQEMKTYLGG